jgi:undecaprenyl-diphosphatase
MTGFEALILGLVQGLTEFLPVSSSGHLVVFQTLFGIEGEGGLVFEVAVHVATLVAILIVYRKRVRSLLAQIGAGEREGLEYAGKLVLGTLPAIVVALAFDDRIEQTFASPAVVGACLLLTAGIVWSIRSTLPRATGGAPGWGAAVVIGCAQAFAILPGISRSGTTVAVALALGVAPAAAAEFSFLLGTVAMAGAAVLILPELGEAQIPLTPIAIGCAAALLSGVAAIVLFLRMLAGRYFHVFSYYLIVVGSGLLVYVALRG